MSRKQRNRIPLSGVAEYSGEDLHAHGGHIAMSPHSAVGIRPWFRMTCTDGTAFCGLAILQELRPQSAGSE